MAATDSPLLCPFAVVVDTNESAPWRFTGIPSDARHGNRPWIVTTVTRPLWATDRRDIEIGDEIHSKGLADYSIDGMESRFQIERKSLDDLYATLGSRRTSYQAEIARLNETCEFSAVIIEAEWSRILRHPPSRSQLSPKIVSRTVASWSIRYPRVHWYTCESRRHAELFAFQLMMKFWEANQE